MPETAQVSSAYPGYVSDHPPIDPDAPKLIYEQVADHIAARIASGELTPGAKLPAERDMAVEYQVAYDTIRRATALLRQRGLIITIVGRGTFVVPEGERRA
jgi:DNA-binding GntR family transcriptional regulator